MEFSIRTTKSNEMFNITSQVYMAVSESKVESGIAVVFIPHTTAGVTINENADPDVITDMLLGLRTAYPENSAYRHFEGNTTAHLKASAMGASCTIPFENGRLLLGTWQGVYFCEFDGPRNRKFIVKII